MISFVSRGLRDSSKAALPDFFSCHESAILQKTIQLEAVLTVKPYPY